METSWYDTKKVDVHSIVAKENDSKDPKFVNYPINEIALTEYVYQDAWDFHVQAGSPVLTGAYNGNDATMQPYFAAGLEVNGVTYTSPKVEARFGAYGTK